MKYLKSTTSSFWAFVAVIALTFTISAQDTNRSAAIPMARKPTEAREALQQSLNLTDGQTKNLEPFFKEQQARMAAMRTNTSLSRQERMAAIKDMRKNADEKMKAHLTPEQLQKMQQTRQQSMQFARPGGPKGHPSAHAAESQEKSKTEPAPEHRDNSDAPARDDKP